VFLYVKDCLCKDKKVKVALSGLYNTDACRHILSLPLTDFTPSSPEALHTKQTRAPSASEGAKYMYIKEFS
jgi:hypothetical protein